jgi:hypothetical protein
MEVHYGVREQDVMEDISNPLANLLQAFVTCAEKIHDVHVVPHGQETPTQKISRSRKRNKTRPIQEMDAELDVHVVSGFIQGGTFSRPSSIRLA